MRVSVIIPIFKVEDYIERCLLSVLRQDYDNLELILVDDCSPDRSAAIAREILSRGGGIASAAKIVTHERNGGLSAARTTGIRAATGDLLYFLDSDDELMSDSAISGLVELQRLTGADCVAGNYETVSDKGAYVSKKYGTRRTLSGSEEITRALYDGDIPIMAWNKLVRKEFILTHDLFFKDGLVNEDELWTFRLALEASVMALSGTPTYRYFVRAGSIMTDKSLERLKSSIRIYNEMVECSSVNRVNNEYVLRHLDRFAFNRYLAIMSLAVGTPVQKELYRSMRQYQRGQKSASTPKELLTRIHLYFPASVGFYLMKLEAGLYLKKSKGRL